MVKGPAGWQKSGPDRTAGPAALARPALVSLRPELFIAASLFIASLVLYLATLAPSVVALFDDSLEFQLVAYQLGIAHPTGYPLYTLLGKIFTFLPVGNVAYRINLMSAVFGAATVALVYLVILAIFTPGPSSPARWQAHLGAGIGAIALAISPVFWRQATIAEVYTLNAFFIALLLLVACLPARSHQEKRRRLLWLAVLAGLSLTHHRTMLLLLPALVVYLYLVCGLSFFKSLDIKTVLLTVTLGLLPLLLYLYLPLRGHIGSLDGAYENTWSGFWRHVSGSGYSAFIFENPFDQVRPAGFYWQLLRSQFFTVVPAILGLLYLFLAGPRTVLLLTGLAFVSYSGFNLFYQVNDIEVFYIPVFLVGAIWSGIGAAFLFTIASTLPQQRRPWLVTGALLVLFAFTSLRFLQPGLAGLRQSYTWQVHDYGLDILQHVESDKPAIVGIVGEMTLIRYFQQTENLRPDVETVAADREADRLAAVERLLREGKTVYLTRELPGAPEQWSLNAVGPLVRVNPRPVNVLPQVSYSVEHAVTPEISLLGYDVSRPPFTGAGPAPLRLTLFWQASSHIERELKVSARLLDTTGQPVAVVDAVPVHFAYPTTAWRPGEVISDVYDLALPTGLRAGLYTPLLIWYDPARNATEVGRVELQPVRLEP